MGRIMVLLAVVSLAAAPPAALTPEQVKLLRERSEEWNKGQAEWKAGKQAEALATMRRALTLTEQVYGPDTAPTHPIRALLADWEGARGNWKEAAAQYEQMERIQSVLWGKDHHQVIDARWRVRTARLRAGWTKEQNQQWDRAVALNQEVFRLFQKGQSAKALPLVRQELQLRRALVGEKHPSVALGLFNLAAQYQALGDHKAALPLYQQALKLQEEVLGRRHPHYAASLNNLAALHSDKGDYRAALPLYQETLKLTEEVLGRQHPDYASTLNNLAMLHHKMGDHKAALPLLQQALTLTEEALGRRHAQYALGLHNLALLHKALGDHRTALPLYQQALKLRAAVQGRRHPHYANSLNSLAGLYQAMGDHKAALPLLQQALKLREEVQGRRHPQYAMSQHNLAVLYKDMGDHKAALPLFRQALKLIEEVQGRRHPHYAACLNNLALLHHQMEDHKAALPLYQQALKLAEEVLGRRHPNYALCLNNNAMLHHEMGDHRDALILLQRAQKVTEEVMGRRHPQYALCLSNLATLHQDLGDYKAALPLAEQALATVVGQLRDNAAVQSDRQQFAAVQAVRRFLNNRLMLLDDDRYTSAAEHVLTWKGQVLLRQQQRRLFLRLATDNAARNAAARLESVTRHLVALRLSPAATRDKFQALEKEQDDAQAALSALSADFRAARAKERVTPETVAKALPEGAVLIDYLFHGTRLSAFVHRRGKPHARVNLGPAAAVVKAIANWRALLIAGRDGGMPAAAMKRLVWTPLEKHLEGAKVVLVSPDGALGMVPFAALPGKKSGSYLIEDVALAVVPVPSAIPDLLAPKKDRLGPTLLTIGDLRYDPTEKGAAPAGVDDRAAPRTGREKFSRLPATAVETRAVRASFQELFTRGTVISLRDGEATKAAVRKALASVRYAHLGTHGYFAPETVRSALAPDKGGRLDERREVSGWHPLLLSGLALSDANREPKPGEEDGILTALEVSEMDLSRLELAVLSACETGLGMAAGGEGLLGMQRAFQVAGARSVIASLWKVDDRATQALMSDFYAAAWDTRKVISRAEALRQAQLRMLRDGLKRGIGKTAAKLPEGGKGGRLPPLYWAAFVLSGDWR